jgi:hypothetical protein
MVTITTLYVIAFSCFSHRVLGVCAQVFVIYIFRFFSTDFFEDNIHSTQSSSAQGEVLQYKHICSCDFYTSRQPPCQCSVSASYTITSLRWVPRMYKTPGMNE